MTRDTAIGQALRRYRAAHRLSWRALSERLGYSSTYAHDLASGRRRASPAAAGRYARALGEDVREWIGYALLDTIDYGD